MFFLLHSKIYITVFHFRKKNTSSFSLELKFILNKFELFFCKKKNISNDYNKTETETKRSILYIRNQNLQKRKFFWDTGLFLSLWHI